jgi:hypothetical protein
MEPTRASRIGRLRGASNQGLHGRPRAPTAADRLTSSGRRSARAPTAAA